METTNIKLTKMEIDPVDAPECTGAYQVTVDGVHAGYVMRLRVQGMSEFSGDQRWAWGVATTPAPVERTAEEWGWDMGPHWLRGTYDDKRSEAVHTLLLEVRRKHAKTGTCACAICR